MIQHFFDNNKLFYQGKLLFNKIPTILKKEENLKHARNLYLLFKLTTDFILYKNFSI